MNFYQMIHLQKQMRKLNVEASSLKMNPSESNKRYEEMSTFVEKVHSVGEQETRTKTDKKSGYGPVTNIHGLINNL